MLLSTEYRECCFLVKTRVVSCLHLLLPKQIKRETFIESVHRMPKDYLIKQYVICFCVEIH